MGFSFPHLIVVLIIVLIIFGAGKLPEIGTAFGKTLHNFKKSMKDGTDEEAEVADAPGTPAKGAAAQSAGSGPSAKSTTPPPGSGHSQN